MPRAVRRFGIIGLVGRVLGPENETGSLVGFALKRRAKTTQQIGSMPSKGLWSTAVFDHERDALAAAYGDGGESVRASSFTDHLREEAYDEDGP